MLRAEASPWVKVDRAARLRALARPRPRADQRVAEVAHRVGQLRPLAGRRPRPRRTSRRPGRRRPVAATTASARRRGPPSGAWRSREQPRGRVRDRRRAARKRGPRAPGAWRRRAPRRGSTRAVPHADVRRDLAVEPHLAGEHLQHVRDRSRRRRVAALGERRRALSHSRPRPSVPESRRSWCRRRGAPIAAACARRARRRRRPRSGL